MKVLISLSQIVIGLAVLNAWLVRFRRATPWRGGNAQSMREEFLAYGLPGWFMTLTGAMKVSLAIALLAGLWIPEFSRPAAIGLGLFMAGAVVMHLKISDPWKKAAPALSLGVLAALVALA